MIRITGNSILAGLVLTALFCLLPISVSKVHAADQRGYTESREPEKYGGSTTLQASIFIAIIPAADLLLDLPSKFMTYFRKSSSTGLQSDTKAVRLTEFERLFFIIGVILQSSGSVLPASSDINFIGLVRICTTNCSTILMLAPVLVFLERCTETFTPIRALIIATLTGVAYFFFTINLLLIQESRQLVVTGEFFLAFAGCAYGGLIYNSAYKFCREKLSTADDRKNYLEKIIRNCFPGYQELGNSEKYDGIDSDLYTSYIPALHMMSGTLMSVAFVAALTSPKSYKPEVTEIGKYILLLAEILVLVTELRIRKNEVARGLIALLESKRSYVRYISHELRTPLNTAFLGLKLLTNDLKDSNDPKDSDRYDTLNDVNLSCTAAVDILNDLLCYEKLDSGILELHKEEINVGEFLRDRVNMFCAQARECGVTLTLITDIETHDTEDAPIPSQSLTSPCPLPVPHPSSSATLHLTPQPIPLSPTLSVPSSLPFPPPLLPPPSLPLPQYGTIPVSTVQSPAPPSIPTSPSNSTRIPPPTNILSSDTMFVDKFKMDQVMRNLISNSLKFTPQGGTVTVRAVFQPESISGSKRPGTARYFSSACVDSDDNVNSNINIRKYQSGLRNKNGPRNWRFLRRTTSLTAVHVDSEWTNSGNEVSAIHGNLLITVTDNGVGISKENQGRLFKEIIQFSPEKLQSGGGSGLGLWITSGIMNLHNGKVSVTSAGEGAGACFTLEIPMLRKRCSHTNPNLNTQPKPQPESSHQQLHPSSCLEFPSIQDPSPGLGSGAHVRMIGTRTYSDRSFSDGSGNTGSRERENDQSVGTIFLNTSRNPGLRSTSFSNISGDCAYTSPSIRAESHLHVDSGHCPQSPSQSTKPSESHLSPTANISSTPKPIPPQPTSSRLFPDVGVKSHIVSVSESIPLALPSEKPDISGSNPLPSKGLDILLVDDSRLNRKMLLKCLRADQHNCVEASDGIEAIAAVRTRINYDNGGNGRPFDAILMDFVMPNMDGPTATKEIRSLGYSAPIFGVTGNGLPSDIRHFLESGADKVLLKPLDIETFVTAMDEMDNEEK